PQTFSNHRAGNFPQKFRELLRRREFPVLVALKPGLTPRWQFGMSPPAAKKRESRYEGNKAHERKAEEMASLGGGRRTADRVRTGARFLRAGRPGQQNPSRAGSPPPAQTAGTAHGPPRTTGRSRPASPYRARSSGRQTTAWPAHADPGTSNRT